MRFYEFEDEYGFPMSPPLAEPDDLEAFVVTGVDPNTRDEAVLAASKDGAGADPAGDERPTISQEEIARFSELRAEFDRVNDQYNAFRNELMRKMEHHAIIEPGHLNLSFSVNYQQRFSKDKLIEGLGKERFDEIKQKVESVRVRRLDVVEAGAGKTRRKRAAPRYAQADRAKASKGDPRTEIGPESSIFD